MAVKKTTTFTESNININNNTSSLSIKIYFSANNSETWFASATLSCTCNGTTKTKNVSHSRGGSVSATFTFDNIAHNSDGTKSVSWSWRCPTGTSVLGTISASGTKTLTTINRKANVTSATNFTDTTNTTLQFSNPGNFKLAPYINFYADSSTTTKLYGIQRAVVSYSSPYTWNLSEAERNAIRNALGTRASAYATVGVETRNGSTILGYSSKGVTFTNVIQPPTFTNFEVEDINPQTLAITNDKNKFIMGYSTLQITISGDNKAIANKGASMSYYLVNGQQYTYSDSVVITIEKWNNDNIEITAVDSRGNSTKVNKTITKAEYTPLEKLGMTVTRLGNVSEETLLSYSGKMIKTLPNGNANILSVSYQYKKTTDENYTTGTTIITPTIDNDGNFSFENYIDGDTQNGFNINNSYNILVTVSDVLSSIQYLYTLNSGIPAIAVKGNNISFHNAYNENDDANIQLNGKVSLNGQEVLASYVLYEDEAGSNSNITLSDSAANYKYFEILYKTNDDLDYSVKVYARNGKKVGLFGIWPNYATPVIYLKGKVMQIVDNTIIIPNNNWYVEAGVKSSITIGNNNYIYITRVIGYK